jgi:RNA polymerase sigma factor (sigma-70 family)
MRKPPAHIKGDPAAYFYIAALNAARSRRTRAFMAREHVPVSVELPDDWDLEGAFVDLSTRKAMREEFDKLMEREQTVLDLYFSDGKSRAQIAQETGLSLPTVKKTFEGAYQWLRIKMQERGERL